ncbi:MAG: hypothetical protein QOJ68_1753 [Blastococcus sp.]|jgi:hypothetical protein|nr:hypothetical protein [Blastococcus sp.]
MKRLVRALSVAALTAGVSGLGLPAAGAADGGLLRLAHLSPDTPSVDVYVDSVSNPADKLVLHGVSYGTISDYQQMRSGIYTVAMRASGAAANTPPVLSTTVQVDVQSARTVAGVGYYAKLGLEVLKDDLTLPPSGKARMRVITAAATAKTLDVSLAGGAPLAAGLPFARTTGYVDVPAGPTMLDVAPNGTPATALPVTLAAGSVYSVVVLDKKGGGLDVRTVLDAASPGVMPVGGVETGVGGAAPAGGGLGSTARTSIAGVGVLATLALVSTAGRRPFRTRRPGRHARHARHS